MVNLLMNAVLYEHLLEAGLIQFGAFATHGEPRPFALHLEMLVSYPEALRMASAQMVGLVKRYKGVNRLLCTADAVGLGTLVSQDTGLPLVYAEEKGHETILVGAYDTGHPTVLIVNDSMEQGVERLIKAAQQVGLDVMGIVGLMVVGEITSVGTVQYQAVLSLAEAVARAVAEGRIPPGMGRMVAERLKQQVAS